MQELEEKILLHVQQFHLFGYHFLQEVKKKVFSILAWFGYKPREDYLEMPKWQQEFEEQFDARLEYNELVNSLERTFKPKYIPILSEFEFSLGERFDFEKEFDNPIKPLSDKGLLVSLK